MFSHLTYLVWLAVFLYAPILLLMRWRNLFWRQRRALGWVLLGALVGGWAWDAASVQIRVWYYVPEHITNIWLLGLPAEEWLWIVGTTLLFGLLTVVFVERERSA